MKIFDLTQEGYHLTRPDWLYSNKGEQRGYIQPGSLKELWFHTGTICNLSCPFCLEGSKPGDNRLNQPTLSEAKVFIDEAISLGVEQFSFTGGEPFVNKDFIQILGYALLHRKCLVLTNATRPLLMRMDALAKLPTNNKLHFRVSLDFSDRQLHDASRGEGNFDLALKAIGELYRRGFGVSVARQRIKDENTTQVDAAYHKLLAGVGVASQTRIVSFPEFLRPGAIAHVPEITENCMTTYQTEEQRQKYMCYFSKMVVKKNGRMRVYACTLTDDDEDYDLGGTLTESQKVRVMLKHHRCYSCFGRGASCSEL